MLALQILRAAKVGPNRSYTGADKICIACCSIFFVDPSARWPPAQPVDSSLFPSLADVARDKTWPFCSGSTRPPRHPTAAAETLNDSPKFIAALADVAREKL